MTVTDGADSVDSTVKCRYCKKMVDIDDLKNHWEPLSESAGNHIGDSGELGNNIRGGADLKNHDLYLEGWIDSPKTTKAKNIAPQAHHLICSEAMKADADYWKKLCRQIGYNINCKENGVYLPSNMQLACQLRIPLHRGGHSAGYGEHDNPNLAPSYPNAVKKELKKLKEQFNKLECNNQKGENIMKALNALSKEIFDNVKDFKWTLTYDGFDYKETSRIGCAGCTTLKAKKEKFKTEYANVANQVDFDRRLAGDEAILKSNDEIFTKISICPREHFSNTEKKYELKISK